MYKHHLSHCTPAIFLTTDQLNKNYIFQLPDENGNTITQYNNHNDYSLEQLGRIFISGHELKQDKNRLSAITQSTYKIIQDSATYLKKVKETTKQSINEMLRQCIKSFENWLNRIAELRREVIDETAVDILTIVSEVLPIFV